MRVLKKLCRILIIIMFICFMNEVRAATYYDGSTSSYDVGSCNLNWHYCWRNVDSSFELQGIRITAYNSNGERISDTVDFTNNKSTVEKINNSRYYMSNNSTYSRIDYIDSPIVTRNISTPRIVELPFKSFIQTGLVTNESLEFILSENLLSTIRNEINMCGSDYSDNCNGSQFLVVEPLTIIWSRDEPYDYYGTYYELTYMIENNGYEFKIGNGVSPFLPGNIAMSLYITDDDGRNFTNFYNKVGLTPLTDYDVNKVSQYINNYNHQNLKNFTVGRDNVDKGFGIGVMQTSANVVDKTPSNLCNCQPNRSYNVCNDASNLDDSGVIDLQTTCCPLQDNSGGEYVVRWENSNTKICQVQCDERYYVEAWSLHNNLNPVNGSGILAGTYVPITGPTVYHKKTCEFASDYNTLESLAYSAATTLQEDCTGITMGACPTIWVTDWVLYDSLINQYKGLCETNSNSVKNRFESIDVNTLAANDRVGNLELELFSKYELEAGAPSMTQIGTIHGVKYDFGFHNTFVYSIKGNVNKYIDLSTSVSTNGNIANDKNVGDGVAKVTTPITTKQGYYNYKIDYYDILSTNNYFTNMISSYYSIGTELDASCPYVITQRNINNICIPTISNNYCGGNPDNNFRLPKIKMQYRPIDLSNPFPGKLGNSRIPGKNWQTVTQQENGVEVTVMNYIDTYITSNRKLDDEQSPEEVYTDRKPIYTITLNSSNISAIREYNKTHSYDDFELSCRDGNGTECISSFLRDETIIDLSGECSTVDVNDRSQFYSCADK